MKNYRVAFVSAAIFSVLLLLGACSGSRRPETDTPSPDKAPLETKSNSAAQPPSAHSAISHASAVPEPHKVKATKKDAPVAATPVPQTPSTAPAPPQPAATPAPPPGDVEPALATAPIAVPDAVPQPATRQVTIPAGTQIAVRMIDSVDSKTDQVGQTFRGAIDSAVLVDGEIVISRGNDVDLRLTRVNSAGELRGRSELQLQLDRIIVAGKSYGVESNIYQSTGAAQGSRTARNAGIGAAIGAAIGAVTGGGKGAAIGAAAGAGSGVAVSVITKGEQVRVPSESRLVFTLEKPVEVTIPAAALPCDATGSEFAPGPACSWRR